MKVTINSDVYRCQDCPHCVASMDGPLCAAVKPEMNVYPEGRTGIHPDCPIRDKEEKILG